MMRRLLVSCFGLGWLPVAPGTWGSLPPALLFVLMCHFSLSAATISIIMVSLALVGSIVCVKFSPEIIAITGNDDPREIVTDEFAGQAVTFLPIGFWVTNEFSARQIWIVAGLGFLLFRMLDIAKPWPIRKLEKLPQAWGILADDLLAGVYAAIVLLICIHLWVSG
jgi:phosphatidylglycerophosphatase A